MLRKITKEMCCTSIKTTTKNKTSFQISRKCKIFFPPQTCQWQLVTYIHIISWSNSRFECDFLHQSLKKRRFSS